MNKRLAAAFKAGAVHLTGSIVIAALAAFLVFLYWYPEPYGVLAGGKNLFVILVAVDVFCGPLLTAVIFNPEKPRKELYRDLFLVVVIQVLALGYGLHSVWQARPLFLVMEVDRFKVVSAPDLQVESALVQLKALRSELRPRWFSGPVVVAIREPKDDKERQTVLMESMVGGRDYAVRPEFYLPYDAAAALKSLKKAKSLTIFLAKYPAQQFSAELLAIQKSADIKNWFYVPVVGRQDWVAILNNKGGIEGFLPGDGF